MKYAILVTMKYTPAWLALPRAERNAFNDKFVNPIFGRYHDRVKVRFFDAEAFSAKASDFALFETGDLKQYYFLMEELRDTPLFTKGYLELCDVLTGIEGGYEEFEREVATKK
jgi:hypothetical protein